MASTMRRVARWEDWTWERMAAEAGRQCGLRGGEAERLRAMVPGGDAEAGRHEFLVRVGVRGGVVLYGVVGRVLVRYAREGLLKDFGGR